MNCLPVLLLVASYQLTSFISSAMEQSSHLSMATFETDLKTGKLSENDYGHTEVWQQPAGNPGPIPATANLLIARPDVPNHGLGRKIDSFNRFINKRLVRLKLRERAYSQRFEKNDIKYVVLTIDDSRKRTVVYRKMPKHELLAAHKEIPGLGNFYQRVVKETNPLERAKIFKNSLVVFKKLPVDQITPSDCEAWLQTAAAIMGVGMEKYNDPDVLMEATAQFGLLDLMTKFHHGGLEGTSQYYKSAENLQRFLTARFSLIKDDTGLKAEAYGIPWASEVLYYDHRVDLNSDLRRYEKWINEALGETLERLNRAKSNFDQETVINGVKANAAMSNKNTSSQEKSAAIMLLSILGCTSPKESQIVLKARASMEPAQLSAMQLKARAAMSDLLRPQLGSSVVGRTDFLIFCHNAQRVQEFQQIFDFPDSLLDPIKFEEVEIFGFRYSRMRNEVLESQIKKDVEITEFSRLIGTSDAEKAEKLPSYMEKLLGPSTDQMRLAKYETWIQTIAQLMEVTKSDPHEALIEEIANAGLLKLMRKFRGGKDPESIKFYESARNLQHVLTLRRLKHEEAIATYSSKENQSDWLSKIFGLEAQ